MSNLPLVRAPALLLARTAATTKIGCEILPGVRYACMDEAMVPQRGSKHGPNDQQAAFEIEQARPARRDSAAWTT